MNAILPRLLWKEYRTLRGLFLGLLVSGWAIQLFLYSIGAAAASMFVALFVPIFFVLGAAGISFALEQEEGTDNFLRMLSVPAGSLLLAKLGACAVGTLLILTPLAVLAAILGNGATYTSLGDVLGSSVFTLSFLVCGILCSLLFSKALNAVWAGAAVGVIVGWLYGAAQFPASLVDGRPEFDFIPFAVALLVSVAIVGIDYWLTVRWLSGRTRIRSAFREWTERTEATGEYAIGRETAPPWWRQSRRLLWQEARHTAPFIIIYFMTAALLLIPGESAGVPGSRPRAGWFAVLVIAITPVMMGVMAFRGEQHRNRFRFLAERGIAPTAVWLSKHAVWLPLAAVMAVLLLCLAPIISRPAWNALWLGGGLESYSAAVRQLVEQTAFTFERQPQFSTAELVGNLVLLVFVGYGIGQAASLLFPRTVTAAFLAVMMSAAVAFHIAIMRAFHVPLLLSVAPIAAIALLTSLIRAPDWLIERNHPLAWLKIAAVVVVPTLLVLVEVACYRVYELPARGPGFDVAAFKQPPAEAAMETAEIYRRAVTRLRYPTQGDDATPAGRSPLGEDAFREGMDERGLGSSMNAEGDAPTKSIQDGWEFASPSERQFVKENADALELALQASRRPACSFWSPAGPVAPSVDARRQFELLRLVLSSARKLESQGDFDAARSRYVAALRMAQHTADDGPLYLQGLALRNEVYAWLPGWAAHPEQDPERVRSFLAQLQKLDKDFPPAAQAIKADYVFAADWIANPERPESWPAPNRIMTNLIQRWMPWERARADRVLNLVTQGNLDSVQGLERAMARRDDLVNGDFQAMAVLGKRRAEWLATTPLLLTYGALDSGQLFKQVVNSETHRRAALTILGLLAWRHVHGELPEHLDQLIGTVPDLALVDPWSGDLFGYRPQGFPAPAPFGNTAVDGGQPVLWSVGAGNARVVPTGRIGAEELQYQVVVDPQVNSGLSDQDLGIAFPIPHGQ